eukprot:COSAG06_NODE_21788_length_745_cov_0.945820_1_plen_69_part_10
MASLERKNELDALHTKVDAERLHNETAEETEARERQEAAAHAAEMVGAMTYADCVEQKRWGPEHKAAGI